MATCLGTILGLHCFNYFFVITMMKTEQILLADILNYQLSITRELILVGVLLSRFSVSLQISGIHSKFSIFLDHLKPYVHTTTACV